MLRALAHELNQIGMLDQVPLTRIVQREAHVQVWQMTVFLVYHQTSLELNH